MLGHDDGGGGCWEHTAHGRRMELGVGQRRNRTTRQGRSLGRSERVTRVVDERTDKLTLTVSGHLRHGGILHHSCRASTTTRHHCAWVVSTSIPTRDRWPHGELLVIHHLLLRLVLTRTGLHLRALAWWGTIESLSCSVAVAIRSRVHGSKPKGRR